MWYETDVVRRGFWQQDADALEKCRRVWIQTKAVFSLCCTAALLFACEYDSERADQFPSSIFVVLTLGKNTSFKPLLEDCREGCVFYDECHLNVRI